MSNKAVIIYLFRLYNFENVKILAIANIFTIGILKLGDLE